MQKPLLSLLIAIVLGLGAAVFAQRWVQGRVAAVETEKRSGVQVVVAASEISFGEKITADSVKTIGWPRESQPEGVFHDVDDVVGKTANQKLVPGEAILISRTLGNASGSSLAALIEPNMRAVTVRVNDVIGVAGFLLPGNRVDVLATREIERNRALTRTLLQDVKVLAVDQSAASEKDAPVVVRAITLQVDPRQAELLVQATGEGTVQMVLRNPDDVAQVQTAALAPEEAPKPRVVVIRQPAPKRAPPPPPGVTVIRQTQVGEVPSP